jgi:hypothetical protein
VHVRSSAATLLDLLAQAQLEGIFEQDNQQGFAPPLCLGIPGPAATKPAPVQSGVRT